MSRELREGLRALQQAVENEGPEPGYHRRVMRKVEKEWPTLMRAVRQVLESPEVRTRP